MRLSVRTGASVSMAAVLAATATGCGAATSGSSPRQAPVRVSAITQAESVVPGQHDSLVPLPPGETPKLPADKVLALLNEDPANAIYLKDAGALTIQVGLYTNEGLADSTGSPTVTVPSYVFTGGRGPCPPSAGPPGNRSPTGSETCAAIVIANASTGERELLNEWVIPG